jgi:plastocyanin
MHRPVLLLLSVVGLLAVAPATQSATRTIVYRASGLSVKTVTVTAGDTVVWRNDDTANHQVVSVNGLFASPILHKGQQWSHTFTSAGSFRYRDSVDARDRFKGTINVKVAPAVSIGASASQIVYGTNVMLTGQINSKAENQEVQIVERRFEQASPVVLATVLTGKDGVFSFQVKPSILSWYQARWGNTGSSNAQVEVAPKVSLGHASRWVSCVFAGRSMQGQKAKVQRKTRFGEWVSIKSITFGQRSCARFTLGLPKGISHLRVKMSVNQAGSGYLSGESHEVTWRRR